MTRRQRHILAAVACLVAVAAVVAGAAASIDPGDPVPASVGGTAVERAPERRAGPTSTTYALVPVTGGPALPTTTAPPPSLPPPPTTSPAATAGEVGEVVGSADGAVLTRPASTATRPVDKAKGCYSAADPGWRVSECGALRTSNMVLLWVVETRGKGIRVLVLREQAAGQWGTVLSAADDAGAALARVGVRGEDVSGDGQPDLVFGFHRPDRRLDVDVVEAPGAVTLHVALPAGAARPVKGELHTWATAGHGTTHEVIKSIGGAWRVVAREAVPPSSVPPSMV